MAQPLPAHNRLLVWLDPQGQAEWKRLESQIELAEGFWLGFLFTPSAETAGLLRERLESELKRRGHALLVRDPSTADDLVASLSWLTADETRDAPYIWLQAIRPVDGRTKAGESWSRAWETLLLRLNERRDALRRHTGGGVILVAPPAVKPLARDAAPDLWSIRALVMEAPAPESSGGREPEFREIPRLPAVPADPATTPVETEDNVHALGRAVVALEKQGRYAEAIPLAERALTLTERILGSEHPQTATSLNNLAGLLCATGDYAAARSLYQRALAIRQKRLGSDDPQTAASLNNLAGLLESTGDYAGARPLYERALTIREAQLGATHPDTAMSLDGLASLLESTGDYAGARPLYERALAIRETRLGPDHPDTAQSLNNVAGLLCAIGDYAGARPLYERALAICEKALGVAHPTTQILAKNLAIARAQAGER